MKKYDNQDIEYIKTVYNINDLQRDYKWAEDDIKQIHEYMDAITEQVKKALTAEQRHFIYIRREKNWYIDKKVYYHVSIKTKIYMNGEELIKASTPYVNEYEKLYKKFGGLERKAALQYAEELRKKYNFTVIKEGFK